HFCDEQALNSLHFLTGTSAGFLRTLAASRPPRYATTRGPYRRDHSPGGGRILRGMRSLGPMPANRYLSRPDIVRSGASRRRHALPRLALLRPDRSIDLHHQPVRLALGRLERGLQRNLEGLRFGSRQRGRLHPAFNDFRRLTGSRREHGLDGLDGLLDLLVRHLLYAVRVLYLHLARHQQRKYFDVHARLLPRDLLNCLLAVLAEMQQQRLHELLIEQVTRAVPVAVGIPRHPWLERHGASPRRQTCSQHEQISDPSPKYECK